MKEQCALWRVVWEKCRGIGWVTMRQRRRPRRFLAEGGSIAVFRWGRSLVPPTPRGGSATEGRRLRIGKYTFYPNRFKPASIYASHRFRGPYVRKVCIDRNSKNIISSFFCMRLFGSTAKHHTKFQGEIQIRRKIIINKKWKFRFSSFPA